MTDRVRLLEAKTPTTNPRTRTCSPGKPLSLVCSPHSELLGNRVKCLLLSGHRQTDKTTEISPEGKVPYPQEHRDNLWISTWAILSLGRGGYSASSVLCPVSPASSVGLAVNPASCAWLPGLLETLWEKLCLGLRVLSCPQGRRSGQLPSTAVYGYASPHGFPTSACTHTPGPSQEV